MNFYIAHCTFKNSWGSKVRYRYLVAAKDEAEAKRIIKAKNGRKDCHLNPLTDETEPGVLLETCLDWILT